MKPRYLFGRAVPFQNPTLTDPHLTEFRMSHNFEKRGGGMGGSFSKHVAARFA